MEGFSSGWGLSVVSKFPLTRLYIVIGIVSVTDLTVGICVVWVEVVATMGEGAVKVTGVVIVGVLGIGWAISLTLYLLLASTLVFLFSFFLVVAVTLCGGPLLLGCVCAWGLCLGPSFPSRCRYVLIFLMRAEYRQNLALQGLHQIIWVVLSLLKVWIPFMVTTLTFTSMVPYGSRHLK